MRGRALLVASFLLSGAVPSVHAVPEFRFDDALDDVPHDDNSSDAEWRFMDIASMSLKEQPDAHYEWVYLRMELHSLGRIHEIPRQPVHFEVQFDADAHMAFGATFEPPTGVPGYLTGTGSWSEYSRGTSTPRMIFDVHGDTLIWQFDGAHVGFEIDDLLKNWLATTWMGDRSAPQASDQASTFEDYRMGTGSVGPSPGDTAAAAFSDLRYDVSQGSHAYGGRGAAAVDLVSVLVREHERSWNFHLELDDLADQMAIAAGTDYEANYAVWFEVQGGAAYQVQAVYQMDAPEPWFFSIQEGINDATEVPGHTADNSIVIEVPRQLVEAGAGDVVARWSAHTHAQSSKLAGHGDFAEQGGGYTVGTWVHPSPLTLQDLLIKNTPGPSMGLLLVAVGALLALRRR